MPAARLSLVDGLYQLSFRLHSQLARVAAEHELSLIQVRLLGILRDREPGMLKLAGFLEMEKSSLSGLVDRAEKRGLLERVPSPDDGRAATVRVTSKGRRLSRQISEAVDAHLAAVTQSLSESERGQLRLLVERVVLDAGPRA